MDHQCNSEMTCCSYIVSLHLSSIQHTVHGHTDRFAFYLSLVRVELVFFHQNHGCFLTRHMHSGSSTVSWGLPAPLTTYIHISLSGEWKSADLNFISGQCDYISLRPVKVVCKLVKIYEFPNKATIITD